LRISLLVVAAVVAVTYVTRAQGTASRTTVYQGARLINGSGGAAIEDAMFVVEGGRFTQVCRSDTVKIPAGARDGTRIRLKGRGEAGRSGGPAGDLWVVTRVTPSPLYERRGSDLVIDVPVTYPEAALGATVEVPTPDGKISLKVPAGSQDGKLLKVKGRGAPKLKGGGRGDLLARLKVTVPKKLTKREREALEELQKVSREDPREEAFSR